MTALSRLFAYNAWANTRIFEIAGELEPAQLSLPVEGIYGSILDTTTHLLTAQENFLLLAMGQQPRYPDSPSFSQIAPRLMAVDTGLLGFADKVAPAALGEHVLVPWMKRNFTVEDCLLQAAIHSTEHRSDLAGALTRLGRTIPPFDYIFWVVEQGS